MQGSVYVALVHNNNQVRSNYVRTKIDLMVNNIGPDYQVKKIEVSYQPEIVPHGFGMAIMREFIYQFLGCKWRKYCLLKSRKLRNRISFLRSLFVKYILNYNCVANRWRRSSAIEMMVTDKHIRTWSQFLDSGADYLIVFEDDVVFKNDSNLRISKLLDNLKRNYLKKPCYVDLGGGFSLADLKVANLEKYYDDNFRHYQKTSY